MAPGGGSDLSRTDIFPSLAATNITIYTLACLLKFQEKFVEDSSFMPLVVYIWLALLTSQSFSFRFYALMGYRGWG